MGYPAKSLEAKAKAKANPSKKYRDIYYISFYSNLKRPAVIAPIIPTTLRNIKANFLRINTGAVRFTTTAPLVPVGIIKMYWPVKDKND
jgi:hypothetical protein